MAVTGFHCKNAMRLLRLKRSVETDRTRPERRIYDEAAMAALVVLWGAADRSCGTRLPPLIPVLLETMERPRHLNAATDVKTKLTAISAAAIDRLLRHMKGWRTRRRRSVAGTELGRSVPIRTFDDWGIRRQGMFDADLVSHRGPAARGRFA